MRQRIGVLLVIAGVFVAGFGLTAQGDALPTITVDGVQYEATKVVGNTDDPTIHFETPGTNPTSAFTDRNVWTGNGSEHLPCPGGIHWIDNKNLLTISHCLTTTTTTTEEPTTTTTESTTTTSTTGPTPEDTTTTSSTTLVPPSSSTTTLTIPPTSSTTTVFAPTTTAPTTPSPKAPDSPESPVSELPFTGTPTGVLAGVAGILVALGGLVLRSVSHPERNP